MKLTKNENYDVIVIGGGPAGCAAAIASARRGSKTLLIEGSYSLGGMATGGLVPSFAPLNDGVRRVYCGIAEELVRASNRATFGVKEEDMGWLPISFEHFKVILDDMVTKSGADVLFGTQICGAEGEDGKVRSILAANKSGLCQYSAKIFIDCTGDGDVAAFAGAEFEKGGEDGELQPASLCFVLTGVNTETYNGAKLYGGNPESPIYKILELGDKYPLIMDTHLCVSVIWPGTVAFNAGHVMDADSTDIENVSRSIIQGRKLAQQFRNALAEVDPETFGNSYLVATAPMLGIRETRRIVGEYVLTFEDYVARRTFEDEIARNCYYIDVHKTRRARSVNRQSDSEMCAYEKGESHGIPFRCLIPRGFSNLLVAGRPISCDRIVMGSTRVMPNCFTTGEAAGVAASMAAEQGVSVQQIDVQDLRAILKKNGAYIL